MYDILLNLEAAVIMILSVYFIVQFFKKYQNEIWLEGHFNFIRNSDKIVLTFILGISIGFFVLYFSWWPYHPLLCLALIISLGTIFFHESFLLALFLLLLFLRPWELIEAKYSAVSLSELTQNDFKISELVSIPKFWFVLLFGNLVIGWNRRIKPNWNNLDYGVLAFLVWVLVPILVGNNKEQLNVYLDTLLRSGLIYFLIRYYFQNEFYYEVIVKTLALIGGFLLVVTLVQFYYQHGGVTQQTRAEAFGLIQNSNDLAALLVFSLPFLIAILPTRILKWIILIVSFYAIYLTQSRGAFLGALVAITTYFMGMKSLKIPALKTLIVGGCILLFVFKAYTVFLGRADSDIHASTMGRVNYWIAAVRMAIRSPIWGVGFGNYPSQFERYAVELFEFGERTAHSSFFLVLAESGIVGIFLFSYLFKIAFQYLRELKNSHPELFAAFCGYTVTMLFLSHSYLIFIYVILALISSLRPKVSKAKVINGGC